MTRGRGGSRAEVSEFLENSPSTRRVDPVGSLVPVAFGHDVLLMSGSLS